MKLVLLGTADSMKDAPFDNREWEIWACAPAISYAACKRVDRIFEVHDRTYWQTPEVLKRINDSKLPVMMHRQVPEVSLSEALPLEDMVAAFQAKGMVGARYFTSTIAYMLAYALYLHQRAVSTGMGYEAIALYGIHMAADEEYGNQRQAMEYWVGVANGMGIQVIVPEHSSICSAKFLYGYDTESTMLTKMREMSIEFDKALGEARNKVDADTRTMYEFSGALKALAKLRRLYS